MVNAINVGTPCTNPLLGNPVREFGCDGAYDIMCEPLYGGPRKSRKAAHRTWSSGLRECGSFIWLARGTYQINEGLVSRCVTIPHGFEHLPLPGFVHKDKGGGELQPPLILRSNGTSFGTAEPAIDAHIPQQPITLSS